MERVAILGNASATRDHAPFGDERVEIWAMTLHALRARRCDAVLEMHPDVLEGTRWEKYETCEAYREWLRTTNTPVWMHDEHPQIPASRRYPIEEIEDEFRLGLWKGGQMMRRFLGGSASYGIALALHMGFKVIELYGVELALRPEYDDERDCVFYWMGRGTERGVNFVIHPQSSLYKEIYYP